MCSRFWIAFASDPATEAPSLARAIAGSIALRRPSLEPCSPIVYQPPTTPGTVTVRGPRSRNLFPAFFTSVPKAVGAAPLALTAKTVPSGFLTRAKRSPPKEQLCGYVTVSATAEVKAASTALPPRSNEAAPTSVASECGVLIPHPVPLAESERLTSLIPSLGVRGLRRCNHLV